jgi:hypothetical protein
MGLCQRLDRGERGGGAVTGEEGDDAR